MNAPYIDKIQRSLDLDFCFDVIGSEQLESCFAVTQLATSVLGAVGGTIANLNNSLNLCSSLPSISVDQRLSSLWFSQSIYPIDWELPPIWDSLAGDYQTKDGWIKLHTNLAHHREAAVKVLDCRDKREYVSEVVLNWLSDELESAIVQAGGVAAALRSREEWQIHPQGNAVAAEPLIYWDKPRNVDFSFSPASQKKPLKGLKVLDLTRVLAGPVATRTLAGFGASVLRVDPPDWEEPNVVPDITLGKRCTRLQLDKTSDREVFERILQSADVLVHGYRPGALDGLGYGETTRQKIAPGLIEVCLDAYGWTGPWAERRGFDSLVQMSSGIAHTGMLWANKEIPTPLPVQALDHATGYLMAAAVIRSVQMAIESGKASNARLSLARTAGLLMSSTQTTQADFCATPSQQDFNDQIELTPWGTANRLRPALNVSGTPMEWELTANNLGTSEAMW